MPTNRMSRIERKTPGMSKLLRPFSSNCPSPRPSSGEEAMISAAISERQENAQPCLRPAR